MSLLRNWFVMILVATSWVAAADKPLNLILILADDLGYETIGANGGTSYQTPNLDRMAASGMRFDFCYAQPLCTPSRVQIMTGQYNDRNYTRFGELKRSEVVTFGRLLKEHGYATCIAGKWQLGSEKDSPQHFGFDQSLLWQHTRGRMKKNDGGGSVDTRYVNPSLERNGVEEDYHNGEFAPDLLVDFICGFIDQNKEGPFLVYYPMILTHCPFVPVPGGSDWDPQSPGCKSYKGDPKCFGGMVNYMDKLVGRIVSHVEKLGLADNTVIVFTGDNGTDKPVVSDWKGMRVAGAKGQTIDAGNHVPLIVHAPGLKGRGVVADLVDFTDFLPTLCDLAGVDLAGRESPFDGHSFAPRLRGLEGKPRDHVFSWYSPSGDVNKDLKVFALDSRYKLYRDGRFFDVVKDRLEKSPLKKDSLTPEQIAIRDRLQQVLDRRRQISGR